MKLSDKLIPSIMTVVIGFLFIMLGDQVIKIALTVVGVALLISALTDFMAKNNPLAIVKAILGIVVIVFGWTLLSLATYLMAIALLISGALQLYQRVTEKGGASSWKYVGPVISIVVAGCLLFNQGGTISWLFTVAGVLLIIEGILQLVECGAIKRK